MNIEPNPEQIDISLLLYQHNSRTIRIQLGIRHPLPDNFTRPEISDFQLFIGSLSILHDIFTFFQKTVMAFRCLFFRFL